MRYRRVNPRPLSCAYLVALGGRPLSGGIQPIRLISHASIAELPSDSLRSTRLKPWLAIAVAWDLENPASHRSLSNLRKSGSVPLLRANLTASTRDSSLPRKRDQADLDVIQLFQPTHAVFLVEGVD